MKGLFSQSQSFPRAPLAERIRPKSFAYFYGQDELVGKGSPLREAIEKDSLHSLIFWGPPGSGKTTLARIIARKTKAFFQPFSAATSGLKEVRQAIKKAQERFEAFGQKTILFIDEIHRFNKLQQDAFLSYVEKGTIVLIGATTENPCFEVISPLLSRASVYVLKLLDDQALANIMRRALRHPNGLRSYKVELQTKALEKIIGMACGDARTALNILELAAQVTPVNKRGRRKITEKIVSQILKKHILRYDKKGEEHYNLISAFIKSMRDSDPNGALYWLARMIESGEDPRFIARRMVIFASEDIGNADPQALNVATSVARAVEFVGMPEAQINLAQGVTYLATAPKSNASYSALLRALKDARKGSFPVPLHLRNAVTNLMKDLGYGKGYKYAHDFYKKGGIKIDQKHFPSELGQKKYYFPKHS